jgi:hypothetical protein
VALHLLPYRINGDPSSSAPSLGVNHRLPIRPASPKRFLSSSAIYRLGQPVVIIEHAFGVLGRWGFIVTYTSPLSVQILSVSPELKRLLEET